MSRGDQLELIFDVKHKVIEEIRHSDPERALCIAELFSETKNGDGQYYEIKGILSVAATRKATQSAQEIAEMVFTKKFCQPTAAD